MKAVDDALRLLDERLRGTGQYPYYLTHRARYRSDALRVLETAGGGPVLEVGAMPCHATALLSLCGVPVVGVDLDPARAQALIDAFSLDVRRCDVEREPLPFADASFGTVLFAETFEHLRIDPQFALSELNRVLRPGGTLLLTTPNFYSAQNIARFVAGRGITDGLSEFSKLRTLGHMGHVREYTHAEVRRFLEASGFAIERVEFAHYHYRPGKRGALARVVFALLPRRFRSFQVVTARKIRPGPGLAPLG